MENRALSKKEKKKKYNRPKCNNVNLKGLFSQSYDKAEETRMILFSETEGFGSVYQTVNHDSGDQSKNSKSQFNYINIFRS